MIESIFFNPWIWIVPLIALVLLVVTFLAMGGDIPEMSFIPGLFVLGILGFYFGAMLPPYDASYYQTYRITGEVSEIQSAFSGDEGTMSQVFVAKVDGVDLYIRSDDQRFRTLEVGDDVNLVCGKGFAYFQEAWYDCSFGGAK